MKRHWALAVLAIAALPRMAHAQEDSGWGPLVRITPAVGFSPSFKQTGNATIVGTTSVSVHGYEMQYASGLPFGATLELHLWNRFSLIAGGAWSGRNDGEIKDFQGNITRPTAGNDFYLAKAGLAVRLQEVKPDMQMSQLDASVFIAPAIIRDVGRDAALAPVSSITTNQHHGLNIGAEGELPLASRHVSFTVGLEDWIIFWNQEDNLQRVAAYLEQGAPTHAVIAVDSNNSHLLVLRAGLTFRF